MYPILPIGPLRLQTYGLFLLLAYWAGLWLAAKLAPRRGLEADHIYNAGFWALIGGLLAARLGHVLLFFDAYRADPTQILSLSPGALVPWAGLLGAVAVLAFYLRRYRLPVLPMADAAAPGVLLALASAALGGFLSGSLLGGLSDLPWAVEAFGVRRHPAGLYEALALLGLLALLLRLDRPEESRPGWLALLALFAYAATRLLLEPFRAESATLEGGWRVAQVVALLVVAASGWLLGRLSTE